MSAIWGRRAWGIGDGDCFAWTSIDHHVSSSVGALWIMDWPARRGRSPRSASRQCGRDSNVPPLALRRVGAIVWNIKQHIRCTYRTGGRIALAFHLCSPPLSIQGRFLWPPCRLPPSHDHVGDSFRGIRVVELPAKDTTTTARKQFRGKLHVTNEPWLGTSKGGRDTPHSTALAIASLTSMVFNTDRNKSEEN